MPGVLVDQSNSTLPAPEQTHANCTSQESDWEQLADKTVQNADLDTADFLPPPLEVITIDDKDDYPITTILPATSYLPIIPKTVIPKIDPNGPPPPIPPSPPDPLPSHYPTCSR
jgi:hypothetical protein